MDPLLSTFQLKHLTLRNRILSTSHAPSFQERGHPRDRYRLYHEEKARGGVGLTMVGGSTNIAPDSPSVFGQLYAGDDTVIPWFRALTDGVRAHGAGIMCQITHMGRRTAWDDGHWLPVLGPSAVREQAHRASPKAMEEEDIKRVIGQFVDAALRCQEGGFDGIELLSHSHLIGQFLSPLVNKREDEYGGSLENRLRFTMEVISAVRAAVGPEFIVGMRVTGDELVSDGLGADECVEAAQRIEQSGTIDFFNVLAGAPYDDLGLAEWVRPMGLASAPHLTIAGRIRSAVTIPVFHAGGIADIATARHALNAGYADLIGMTRAQMADPYLVEKLSRGEEQRIRPCAGLGYCVDRVNQGKPAVCGHNAATGREATLHHKIKPSDSKRRVVVVGGGPGGLEAARVGALRGHEVILFEASDRLGGQLNLAAKGVTRRQIWGVADWLINEVNTLAVDVRLNVYADGEEVLKENPDAVIVATGGWPGDVADMGVTGAQYALSSWDVMGGEVRISGEVLLYDEMGDQAAGVCADFLSRAGSVVRIVTPDRTPAHDLGPTNSAVVLRDLMSQGVSFDCFYRLSGIELDASVSPPRKKVTLTHVLTGAVKHEMVDHVVIENATLPMDSLYYELKPKSRNLGQLSQSALIDGVDPFQVLNAEGQFDLARIGDAISSRNIHAALYDALRICQNI